MNNLNKLYKGCIFLQKLSTCNTPYIDNTILAFSSENMWCYGYSYVSFK